MDADNCFYYSSIAYLGHFNQHKMRQFNVRLHNHLPHQLEIQVRIMNANPREKQTENIVMMKCFIEKGLNSLKPLFYSLRISAIFLLFLTAVRGIWEAKLPSLSMVECCGSPI